MLFHKDFSAKKETGIKDFADLGIFLKNNGIMSLPTSISSIIY